MEATRLEEIQVRPTKNGYQVITRSRTPYGRVQVISTGTAPKAMVRYHMEVVEKKVEALKAEGHALDYEHGYVLRVSGGPVG
jgi:hypothetical protein